MLCRLRPIVITDRNHDFITKFYPKFRYHLQISKQIYQYKYFGKILDEKKIFRVSTLWN